MKIDVGHAAKLANLPTLLLTLSFLYGNIDVLKSPATPQGLCRIFLGKKLLYA
ncbi:hypothetical protein HYT17_01990 [Candidatus Microgenomates bacterium]|nr:hypothetical protein [Candidatus Microgenomates bacterium]